MAFINYSAREINCKLVYYGPGLCGKTTNLKYIYERIAETAKGKMISLATESERTLFFDFLPLSLGEIRGYKTRFHLYTVPGQVFYDASRKLILKGVDGVVFVADSQEERFEANLESMDNLRGNLREQGSELDRIPCVIQYNKRDLGNAMPVAERLLQARQERSPARHQHQVHAVGGDLIGERGSDSLGSARHQRPRPIAKSKAIHFQPPGWSPSLPQTMDDVSVSF